MEDKKLFENYKYCEICKRPLPLSYNDTVCPACQEIQLFREVKDYIRQNDVNEYNVAEHFNIPLQQVKKWIREGRIEYKENSNAASFIGVRCQNCGAPITFGTLCPKCLKKMNTSGYSGAQSVDPSHMRYLDTPDHRK